MNMQNWTLEEIKNLIADIIYDVTGKKIENYDRHLLCREYAIPVSNFLYVFDELEQRIKYPVTKIFETKGYTVFTINHLADAILERLHT